MLFNFNVFELLHKAGNLRGDWFTIQLQEGAGKLEGVFGAEVDGVTGLWLYTPLTKWRTWST